MLGAQPLVFIKLGKMPILISDLRSIRIKMSAAEVISGISLKFWRMTSLQAWSSNIIMDIEYTWIL